MLLLLLLCVVFVVSSKGHITDHNSLYLDGWTMAILHSKCSGAALVGPDGGDDGSNTVEACARKCEELGPSCASFGYIGNSGSKCHYYSTSCDINNPKRSGSKVVYGTHLDHAIYMRSSELDNHLYKDIINIEKNHDLNKRCTRGKIKGDRGHDDRGTLESCFKNCFEKYKGQCVSVSYKWKTRTGTQSKCFYNNNKCTKFEKKNGWTSSSSYRTYWLDGYMQEPTTMTSDAQEQYEHGNFEGWTVNGQCPIKKLVWTSSSQRMSNAKLRCPDFDVPGVTNGLLNTSLYVYNKNIHEIDVCAKECLDWNGGLNQTNYECRSFNMEMESADSDNFRCTLYSCDPWTREEDRHVSLYSSGRYFDSWGFMDNFISSECSGNFKTEPQRGVDTDYKTIMGKVCDSSKSIEITSYQKCSVTQAHQYCLVNWDKCMALTIDSESRTCRLYSTCIPVDSPDTHDTLWLKTRFGAQHLYVSENKQCNGGYLNIHSDEVVSQCLNLCDNTDGCKFFEMTSTGDCELFDDTCSLSDTVGSVVYKMINPGETPSPTPAGTPIPDNVPECFATSECIGDDKICTKDLLCETIPCSKHEDCYNTGLYLPNRLAGCNLKKRVCEDLGESWCGTMRRCRSLARKKWRDNHMLSRAAMRSIGSGKSKKRQAAEQIVQDAQVMVAGGEFTSSVYVGVLGREDVEIDTNTLLLMVGNESMLYESIVTNFCGDASIGCNYTLSINPTRRLLQDENVTITITYDIDGDLYQDLINSGYQFGSNNLTDAIAADLGLNASDVVLVDNGGIIEVEITIVDDSSDGEPIGDELIGEIESIQENLNNITQQVIEDIGGNDTTVLLNEVDYCGSRACNSVGTCNATSGYCDCNPGHQGINCEISRICNHTVGYCANGGNCSDDGLQCHCVYPYKGVDCTESVNCGC